MKKLLIITFGVATFLSQLSLFSQDSPDSFASVSGKGLTTTTGGEGAELVEVEDFASLNMYASSTRPYVIIVKGLIEAVPWNEIKVNSNKTIVGYGTDATLKNIELNLINKQNVIIRNLIIRDSYVEGDPDGKSNDNDAIQADSTHHLWIDHCFFTHCGDGLIDLRKSCDYVTVSYTHLSNHNKAFGLGWTTNTDWRVSIHHCWFDNLNQRNPSFDMGMGHLYNNYMSDVTSYGNLARGNAKVVIQNSYFENSNDPLKISDAAILYSSGNQFSGCSGNQNGNASVMPYDPKDYYEYTLDPTNQVKSIVTSQSGPQAGISDQYYPSAIEAPNQNDGVNYFINNKTLTLNANSANNVLMKIYSVNGKLVEMKNISLQSDISLDMLTSGIYIIQLDIDGTLKTERIIIR